MTVSIGFNNSHHFRDIANAIFYFVEVRGKIVKVYFGPGWTLRAVRKLIDQ